VDSHAEHRSLHTVDILVSENVLYTSHLPCHKHWKLTLLMIQHGEGYQGHFTKINLLYETAETVIFHYDPFLTCEFIFFGRLFHSNFLKVDNIFLKCFIELRS